MLSECSLTGFVPVTDAERARAFYGGVLGLELVRDDGFALVFRLPQGTLRVVRVGEFTPQSFTVLGWEVAEMEAEMRTLTAAGAVFERFDHLMQDELGIWTAPDGSRVAWLKDPDGNVLSLSQHPSTP